MIAMAVGFAGKHLRSFPANPDLLTSAVSFGLGVRLPAWPGSMTVPGLSLPVGEQNDW